MMTRELIQSLYVPVLIGDRRTTARTARKLFWQYGLISHVFSLRPALLHRLTPWVICHPLPHGQTQLLSTLALSDFADEILNTDRQPLLFLCNADTATWSDDALAPLECRYLILCANSPLPFTLSSEGDQTI
jgi:hypothetical protein